MAKAKKRVKVVSDNMTVPEILKCFLSVHWRGVLTALTPIIFLFVILPLPAEPHCWTAYTLLIMAVFWMTECIPIAITGFIPVILFSLSGVMSTREVCRCFMNDTIIMFLGSLFLANCIEQSGVHKRLVFLAVRIIGYSHFKLLLAMCAVTTFVSMWISNTAATTMMVPINFALLKVFEEEKVLKVYDTTPDGELVASDMTTCYFCAAAFSASIGGIGTLVGTGTNLVFKGLFTTDYPKEPDYLSFPLFSAFAVPYMIAMELSMYLCLVTQYFGAFRPHSPQAKNAKISQTAKEAAKKTVEKNAKALGPVRFHEIVSLVLFSSAMVLFFCRSPQIFVGWADIINESFGVIDPKYILDSAVCSLAIFIMMSLPNCLDIFKHLTVKYVEDMPKKPLKHILDWTIANKATPYAYMFLLGGGFALSTAAKMSGLNDRLGDAMEVLKVFPSFVVILLIITVVVLVTNFATNVAVANVFVPIAMSLAKKIGYNPLWFCITAGFSASYCFMLPVGTPPNLVVQGAAKIPTSKMIQAGFGPTVTTIIVSWFAFYFWAPIMWPAVYTIPEETPPD